jgi:hypothetical protein
MARNGDGLEARFHDGERGSLETDLIKGMGEEPALELDAVFGLDIDNKAVAAFRERGLVYKKLGDIAAAIADLTWFTRFEPRDHGVVRAIEEMQEVSPHTIAPQGANPQNPLEINLHQRISWARGRTRLPTVPKFHLNISSSNP